MNETLPDTITGAQALLRALKSNGVDWMFVNPGSDFAPIIEAYASSDNDGFPQYITAPHENICVSMAHGYWLATGRMQTAAVHVNVGLANAVMGLLNAQSDDVPLVLLSGRTPQSVNDRMGGRSSPIQYGQDMFDQTALVREAVKWSHELHYAENAIGLVSRACAIARSEPTGSVYLSLPREPLCEMTQPPAPSRQVKQSPPHPDPAAIRMAAHALSKAAFPLIIASRGDPAGALGGHLSALAQEQAIAVSETFVTRNLMATRHPAMIGPNVAKHMQSADVVLVLDSAVAWIESQVRPPKDATIIHMAPDPLFARMPFRTHRCDLAIACDPVAGLAALRAALPPLADDKRRNALSAHHDEYCRTFDRLEMSDADGISTKAWVAKCVSEAIGDRGTIVSERGGGAANFRLTRANQWFGNTQAGGLGWALPAALGIQLADRERLVACLIGDGGYLFANPLACYQVANAANLPVLTLILNNGGWDAVRTSTLEVYPQGGAATANQMPMVSFGASPDFAAIGAAMGAWTESVRLARDLQGALERAIDTIQTDRRQVILDVQVAPD